MAWPIRSIIIINLYDNLNDNQLRTIPSLWSQCMYLASLRKRESSMTDLWLIMIVSSSICSSFSLCHVTNHTRSSHRSVGACDIRLQETVFLLQENQMTWQIREEDATWWLVDNIHTLHLKFRTARMTHSLPEYAELHDLTHKQPDCMLV